MRKITLISALLATSAVFAQPILNSSNMQGPGVTIVSKGIDAPVSCEGSAGPNQNWNFANFPYNAQEVQYNYVTPSSVPVSSNFPGSTLGIQFQEDVATVTSFVANTLTAYNYLGNSVSVSGTTINIIYNNPRSEFSYPVAFGNTFSDTFRGTGVLSQLPFFDINIINSGNLSYEVDGYGTLTTFTGIYDNVLRLKYRSVFNDTTSTNFPPDPPTVDISSTRSTLYRWIQVTNNSSFALLDVSYDTTVVAGEPDAYDFTVTHYYPSTLTSAKNVESNEVKYFPNPTNGLFNLILASDRTEFKNIIIRDISGKAMKTYSLEVNAGGSFHQLDISDLASGTYFISINGSLDMRNYKIIKQ